MAPRELMRMEAPSRDTFEREILPAGRPVVITGALRSWPALSSWSEGYFRSRLGGQQVPVELRGNALNQGEQFVDLTFDQYFDHLAAGRQEYFLSDQRIDQVLPPLVPDAPRPAFLEKGVPILFIGQDSFASMHYHPDEQAVLCQVVGRKRVLLYAPEDFGRIYPEPWYSPRYNWSRIDFSRQDPGRGAFPRLGEAVPHECVLEPGEALFIPIHWWHCTWGQGMSYSVSFFWKARRSEWFYPTPGVRSYVGTRLTRYLYLPASRIKALERFYYALRRLRFGRARPEERA